ncbi:MBL fold metallo-hydrolase [Stenomitos frigidus]|uniref:Zn-dependent hydrolase n=1 Tax=Stenomitos frigidus ULC18 TaxID=2107698 RepID=A0A2T1E2Q9_9CYAN|nr:MBL fold metallo-hydrolase [Stenomitos frigidus]PSB27028.1 Zn-dependent hydrolase [Stenomitos frigidus ULC18]
MRRRQLMRYAGAGLLSTLGLGVASGRQGSSAQAGGALSVKWLGHSCFLFTGEGRRILVNPFRSLGCTAGYRPPKVATELVLISSQLLDEGAVELVPGNPRLLYEPGVYQFNKKRIQGIRTDHDRLGGKRFGTNVAWQWKQGGLNLLHLGGIAAPISLEQKILMGRPDVLFVPVGGGPNVFTPEEAKQAIQVLNPKLIVPMHYRTKAVKECDSVGVEQFLTLMSGTPVRRGGDTMGLRSSDLPKEGMAIQVFSYQF